MGVVDLISAEAPWPRGAGRAAGAARRVPLLAALLAGIAACGGPREVLPTGMVASATPEATQAGLDILAAGGNAVDAAVAVSLALGVTEPAGSGLGGQTVMLVYGPGDSAVVVDGSSVAPAATPTDATSADLTGRRLTTVPTTVKTLAFAQRELGSGRVSWADVLAPAIRYAEDGWALEGFRQRALVEYQAAIRASPSAAALLLNDDGTVPAPGSLQRQPVLARTLRRLAQAGPEDFYTGEIAAAMDRDMRAHDGWLTAEDLADAPDPKLVPAITTEYRGRTVYTAPPPYGGWVVLQALNVLQQTPQEALSQRGRSRTAWLAEALRFGHGSRLRVPIPDLDDWAGAVARRIDPALARQYLRSVPPMPGPMDRGETTHFTVVDRTGLAVAVTQSVNSYFGAKAASPELGFPYNSYMLEFEIGQPDHPFALRPGARPLSSMSPTVVARDGRVELALGSPGSSRIISSIVQVISDVVDGGMTIQQAVAEPRIHLIPGLDGRDILYLEGLDPVFDATTDETGITRGVAPLSETGADHELTPSVAADFWGGADFAGWAASRNLLVNGRASGLSGGATAAGLRLDPYFGGIHAVLVRGDTVTAAADPRRDGTARAEAGGPTP